MQEDYDFWANACNSSVTRPVSELKLANYAANGIAVSKSVNLAPPGLQF
jgi:hypothetical protein